MFKWKVTHTREDVNTPFFWETDLEDHVLMRSLIDMEYDGCGIIYTEQVLSDDKKLLH